MTHPPETSLGLSLSAKAHRTHEQPISFLIAEALRNPLLVNLAAGLVDDLTLPVEECARITHDLFADPAWGRAALQYGTTHGFAEFRRTLLAHLEEMEGKPASTMKIGEDDLVVTTGSQQALYLIADAMIDAGDIVIAAAPSYFVFAGVLQAVGAKVMAVPMDNDGMDVDAVEALLTRLKRQGELDRVKLIYCTSYYQNPTGLTLSAARRPKLLELAKRFSRKHRILILEDAAYRELRYDGAAYPSIKSYDPDNLFTIISHTFSKPFSPGLKVGYTAMPQDLLHAVVQQKGNHDFGSSNLTQHMAWAALRGGAYAGHVKVLQAAYRAKRDRMLAALDHHLARAKGIHWTRPHGGLYVWLTLPPHFNTAREAPMFRTAVDAGVLYVPGAYCFQPDEHGKVPQNHLRLSFGQVAIERIDLGIERLAGVVRGHM